MLTRMIKCLPRGMYRQLTKLNLRALVRNQKRDHHCVAEYHPFNNMGVQVIPALHDNYMYLIVDKASRQAAVVDPVKPKLVMEAVEALEVDLTKVLTTHHHWDHAGGNMELLQMIPKLPVYGGDERIGGLTHKICHNSKFQIGNLHVLCIATPCHTAGDICYFVSHPLRGQESAVFSGDTLFIGGCGKFLEGTAEQMHAALEMLSNLPNETMVYCGHEYTVKNLNFASYVEPTNKAVRVKYKWSQARIKAGKPTVPSTIGEEKMYNPFMRLSEPSVMQHARTSDALDTMKALRQEKDTFTVTS